MMSAFSDLKLIGSISYLCKSISQIKMKNNDNLLDAQPDSHRESYNQTKAEKLVRTSEMIEKESDTIKHQRNKEEHSLTTTILLIFIYFNYFPVIYSGPFHRCDLFANEVVS